MAKEKKDIWFRIMLVRVRKTNIFPLYSMTVPNVVQFESSHFDQKTAGNLRISGFFLCNLYKYVSLVPFHCNYFATFPNVPKGRKHQYIVDLQFPDTTYCIFPSDLHNSPGKDTAWNSRAPPPSPVWFAALSGKVRAHQGSLRPLLPITKRPPPLAWNYAKFEARGSAKKFQNLRKNILTFFDFRL